MINIDIIGDNPYNLESERAEQRFNSDEKSPYKEVTRLINSEVSPYAADAKLCTYRFSRMNGK